MLPMFWIVCYAHVGPSCHNFFLPLITHPRPSPVPDQAKALKYELQTQIPNPLLGDIEDDQPVSPISADAEIGSGRPGNRAAVNAGEDRRGGGGGCCCFGGKKPMSQLELRAENDRRRTIGMPLLDEEEGLTAKEARERRKEVRQGRGGGSCGKALPLVIVSYCFVCAGVAAGEKESY